MHVSVAETVGPRLLGNKGLLERPRRTILISRTERRPEPATEWVRAIVEAVNESVGRGEVVVTGLGRTPFDIALTACQERGGAAIVVLDEGKDLSRSADRARNRVPDDTLFVSPSRDRDLAEREGLERVPLRDRWLGLMADRAWRIHTRKRGNMASLADWMKANGCEVHDRFAVPKASANRKIEHPPLKTKPEVSDEPWPYLTHYTREPDGAWPDESPAEYARWLAFGPSDGRRGPGEALFRILQARKILGSGRLMPGRRSMVSFTARPPWDMDALTCWRPSLRRWSFRPYGLAIHGNVLVQLGTRAVSYRPERALKALPDEDRAFAQKHEPPATDWSGEAEWRLPGNLELRRIPDDAKLVLVPTAEEAAQVEGRFGLAARAICG
jgi:hypothetical protein